MSIRVGTRTYFGGQKDPEFDGFEKIISLTKSTEYGSLGPYALKVPAQLFGYPRGSAIFENFWQAAKLYPYVPAHTDIYGGRYNPQVTWSHPEEMHYFDINKGEFDPVHIRPEYWAWKHKLLFNVLPVRYPVPREWRPQCMGSLVMGPEGKLILLDYIEARKQIYLEYYRKLVKIELQFKTLLSKLRSGKNLLIIEVDGPHQESLGYYKHTYGVGDDFIINNTMLATPDNLNLMLNDPKHAFGHGYALAMCLNEELSKD